MAKVASFASISALNYLLAAIFIGLTIHLGYNVQQSEFWKLCGGYLPFFILYLFVYQRCSHQDVGTIQKSVSFAFLYPNPEGKSTRKTPFSSTFPHPDPKGQSAGKTPFSFEQPQNTLYFFISVSILLRLILVFAFPGLSDDIYRFVWDGRLLLNGHNPFDQLPVDYMAGSERIPGLTAELYAELNSPNYFTIYPPVCQAIFAGACWLFPQSVYGAAVVMKIVFLLLEIGSILLLLKLLRHFQLPEKRVLLYALNPLIIIELVGNLHFEAAMVFFLLLAFWLLVKGKWQWSAVAMALSITSKLLPLMFLPLLIRRLAWRKSILYFSLTGFVLLLLFFPLLNGVFLSNFGDSLNLYFQKFEFNASVYYISRWVGYLWVGYNPIQYVGPVLALLSCLGILFIAWRKKDISWAHFPVAMLWCITCYLLLTTTVHPWYLSLPIVCCVFSRFRYPIVWSGFIMLTYVNYSYPVYQENLWVVALEYLAVLSAVFWFRRTSDTQ